MAVPTRVSISLIASFALTALVLDASVARAQHWLSPAYASDSETGPQGSKGAVIWSHGRSAAAEEFQAPSPPYLSVLRESGWDIYRFNRMRIDDLLEDSAASLVDQVRKLRSNGYQHVVLAGQSFGAFLSLMAAGSSDQVDAVIATAPAAFGSFAENYEGWRNNATKLYRILERIRRARVMIFYFHNDEFDPGGRGERSREILTDRHIENVIIDQPPGLISHWAAGTSLFQRRFGTCITNFLDERHSPETGCGLGAHEPDVALGNLRVISRP